MTFRKGGGRRKKPNIKCKGEEIEEVKTYNYLGYTLKENNSEEDHVKAIVGKTKAMLGKVWRAGERLLKGQWQLRMKLLDALVRGIIMY